ncbi:PEP-CTERM domain protein [Methylovorus mays]|uniref:PEP-CTERM domain protein n=1 Tax=Methylovorus mays TaxID=184077 RepID=UPI001E55E3BE|nr:PEP-CTERM domain protein [Methylovorus mays]MCB5205872.1 PEP-CTERM domain protein [Methylovorus mays]
MKRALGTTLIAAVVGLSLTHAALAAEMSDSRAPANFNMSEPVALTNNTATLLAMADTGRTDRFSMTGTADANILFDAPVVPTQSTELALRPVPEPKAVMLLTGLGLLMFVGYRRSRL